MTTAMIPNPSITPATRPSFRLRGRGMARVDLDANSPVRRACALAVLR
jgi:hypothetical protein